MLLLNDIVFKNHVSKKYLDTRGVTLLITYYFIAFITIVGFFRFSADRKISKSLFIISDDLYIL